MVPPWRARLTVRFARGLSSMSMQAESLEVLEKASVAPTQARAIVRAIEIEIAGAKDTLATKQDVLGLHQALDVLRAEFRGEMTRHPPNVRGAVGPDGGDARLLLLLHHSAALKPRLASSLETRAGYSAS